MASLVDFIRDLIIRRKSDETILEYLRCERKLVISRATLHRYMKQHGIVRYDRSVTPAFVHDAIRQERRQCGQNAGIRFLQIGLRQRHGLLVSRMQVASVCRLLVGNRPRSLHNRFPWERRMRYCPGPNYRWCEDGHDKLGKFGIYIHGCIDEYSRRLIWLRAFTTNRVAVNVARYYLEAVNDLLVVPEFVNSDFGHESADIAACQQFFFRDDDPFVRRHRWCYSINNVTIEAFWRRFRTLCGQFWMNEFESLMLDRVIGDHNSHVIRAQSDRIRPSGVPEDMYNLPHMYGGRSYGRALNRADFDTVLFHSGVISLEEEDFLPGHARCIVDDWMVKNRVSVTMENASLIYRQLRNYFLNNV